MRKSSYRTDTDFQSQKSGKKWHVALRERLTVRIVDKTW